MMTIRLINTFMLFLAFSAFAEDDALVSIPTTPSQNEESQEIQSTSNLEGAKLAPQQVETITTSAKDNSKNKIMLLRPGSKLKNPYSDLVNLGLTGRSTNGIDSYSEAAAQYCKKARDEKNANALFALAWLYTNGRGVEKNDDMAALFFKMAAQEGHERAQSWLSNSKGDASKAVLPACMQPDPPANIASVHQENNLTKSAAVKQFYSKGPVFKLVSEIAPRFNLDIDLVMAFIAVESGFNTQATSPKNAQGLMQLIPETAARFNVKDAYDAKDNIKGGAAYLQWLLAHFKGDVALVAAAYNAGENAVIKYQGIPPYPETRAYVKKITSLYPSPVHHYRDDIGVTPALMNVSTSKDLTQARITKP